MLLGCYGDPARVPVLVAGLGTRQTVHRAWESCSGLTFIALSRTRTFMLLDTIDYVVRSYTIAEREEFEAAVGRLAA